MTGYFFFSRKTAGIRIIESLRLEKISKIIKSNHQPNTTMLALKAKEEKIHEKIPFSGCYISTTIPRCSSELRKLWSKPDSAILGTFQYRKQSSARLISFLEHLRTKLIKSFMTENSCGNIGKMKSYETIDEEYLSTLEGMFSPVDAPPNFDARRSNLCQ